MTLQIEVSTLIVEHARRQAQREGRSLDDLVELVLKAYLDQHEPAGESARRFGEVERELGSDDDSSV